MTKYNSSFKQQVVAFYLQNGINGLAACRIKQHYSLKFKLSVVQVVRVSNFILNPLIFILVLLILTLSVKGCKPFINKE